MIHNPKKISGQYFFLKKAVIMLRSSAIFIILFYFEEILIRENALNMFLNFSKDILPTMYDLV